MTFAKFEEIVKTKYPQAEVFKHGEFGNRSKINVTVIFEPCGKCYSYNGSYVYVLNRLGIQAVYKHDVEGYEAHLQHLNRTHGSVDFFGKIINNTKEIAKVTADLKQIKETCIIV